MDPETHDPPLTGALRRNLRRLAHPLRPVVQLGDAGLSDGVVDAVDRALEDHELIKVKLSGERDERKQTAADLAERTRSELAGLVGRVAVLYRPASDPERRRVDPTRRSA